MEQYGREMDAVDVPAKHKRTREEYTSLVPYISQDVGDAIFNHNLDSDEMERLVFKADVAI